MTSLLMQLNENITTAMNQNNMLAAQMKGVCTTADERYAIYVSTVSIHKRHVYVTKQPTMIVTHAHREHPISQVRK
jgi:hypothetical protein